MGQYKAAGFSLLELMIVIVIVATLSTLAYPSYQQHIIRSNRAAAQQYLLEVASLQHQFILDNRSYATTLAALGASPNTRVADHYIVTIADSDNSVSPPTFTLQAAPRSGSVQQGSDTVSINHLGQKNVSWYQ
ncbi:MAG: type IV pilin protein [Porticoccaceae bacterium]|nr:type IV pilin protein [Porticoccaceae bacterium]